MHRKKLLTMALIFIILSLFMILEIVFFNYLYKITPRVRVKHIGTKTIYKIKK